MLDKMDLHTHTTMSGHAYNTRNEMIQAAWEKGLQIYGITEHAPAMPGSCHNMYFSNFRVLPRRYKDMTVLYGAELNILDFGGRVDLPESLLKEMDLTLASIHLPCYLPGTAKENTDAYVEAMKNPYVNIIAHPDDVRFPIDYERLVKAAKEYHVLLEVNNASLSPTSFRGDPRERYRELLQLCMVWKVPVVMDSDAHADVLVGNHEFAEEVLKMAGFPEELVVNYHHELLREYINRGELV
ncbi:MAG: phosphatase [Lachnospiraceae bacterium]|jgi:putative hydrolase|nr:phosphatase [Lachnospiraceae bacterium]MCI8871642.1 phosphatase [Lachnospiraceae bacterium]MCI9059716.1 phosphatase [Lachnospiraceae bacterium]GFI30389.1 putative phosphatase YcdX [Lachnospiraceae bacterium]